MDIEMIKFTGLLSIMLLFGWILITIFFIIVTKNTNKTVKEQMKNGGKKFEKENK